MERTSYKFIPVSENQKGRVIGKKWRTAKEIQQKTGAKIEKTDGGFKIYGNADQIRLTENEIKSIVNSGEKRDAWKDDFKKESLHIQVPECAVSTIIGKHGDKLKSVMEETNTEILMLDKDIKPGHFYIKGADMDQREARLRIKNIACHAVQYSNSLQDQELPWFDSFSFVDGKSVDKNGYFKLLQPKKNVQKQAQPVWTTKNQYKLAPLEENYISDQEQADEGSDRYGILKENVRKVLQKLHEHCDKHVVDIWCLFGNAYITDVDEVDESKEYLLKEVQERFSDKDNPWHSIFYKGEIRLEELKGALIESTKSEGADGASESTSGDSYVRCAFSILTPSYRNVRIKVFLKSEEKLANNSLSFYNRCPESVKGVIKSVHSDDGGPSYFLCKPPRKHMKATIFCPFDQLDCYLMIRTKMKTPQVTSKEEEEENQVIIDFLNKNLVIQNGKLQTLEKASLPVDYDVQYWRQSKRTMFQYPSKGFNFTIKITEDENEKISENEAASGEREEVECLNDVQLRCNEWDKGFSTGEWKPEQIIQNLPIFLSLVNEVHQIIDEY